MLALKSCLDFEKAALPDCLVWNERVVRSCSIEKNNQGNTKNFYYSWVFYLKENHIHTLQHFASFLKAFCSMYWLLLLIGKVIETCLPLVFYSHALSLAKAMPSDPKSSQGSKYIIYHIFDNKGQRSSRA